MNAATKERVLLHSQSTSGEGQIPGFATHQDDLPDGMQGQEELEIAAAVRQILKLIGEDPTREGLVKTPERFARAIRFLTQGYRTSLEAAINDAIFTIGYNELVVVKEVPISSLCEHHLLPFTGKLHVGYVSAGRVLGLSKVARIAELYSRRLQVQERLTQQIADAIEAELEPSGVAVVLECVHMCMSIRGAQTVGATTITLCKKGIFNDDAKVEDRFHTLIDLSRR